MKIVCSNTKGKKILTVAIAMACVLSLLNVKYSYAVDWNPLKWGKTTITAKHKYTLVFFDQKIPDKEVILVKTTNNYEIIYLLHEGGEEQTIDCNELKEIVAIQPLKNSARVGLSAIVAGAAISVITGGVTAPIVFGMILGGGVSYLTRGLSPSEFCHK